MLKVTRKSSLDKKNKKNKKTKTKLFFPSFLQSSVVPFSGPPPARPMVGYYFVIFLSFLHFLFFLFFSFFKELLFLVVRQFLESVQLTNSKNQFKSQINSQKLIH